MAAAFSGILVAAPGDFPGSRVLFETGFEPFEGYDPQLDLAGQNGWYAFGSGGNGLLNEKLEGFAGQVAYVGYVGSTNQDDSLSLIRPVSFSSVGTQPPVVRFTVTMAIMDSSTNAPFYDDFRWSVYNTQERRLFSLDFANAERHISYLLDGKDGFVDTGFAFRNGEPYDVEITLNYARNVWTAVVNGTVIVPAAPITTHTNKLDLGDIDAVWSIRTPGSPGDNFMVFDDYRIVLIPLTSIPPYLEALGILQPAGVMMVRIVGEPGVTYALDAGTLQGDWTEVVRGVAPGPDGLLTMTDPRPAASSKHRLYRARVVSP